jgi:hypothetical protein
MDRWLASVAELASDLLICGKKVPARSIFKYQKVGPREIFPLQSPPDLPARIKPA